MNRITLMFTSLMLALLMGLVVNPTAQAAGEYYAFETTEQERRFTQLTGELRCPKCQNQSIADSDAPLAQDMRLRVYQMIMEGRTNAEIIEFMKVRYGDFVHYRPPVNRSTLVLWFGPFVALFIGIIAVVVHVRGKRKGSAELTDEERATIAAVEAEIAKRNELEQKEQDR